MEIVDKRRKTCRVGLLKVTDSFLHNGHVYTITSFEKDPFGGKITGVNVFDHTAVLTYKWIHIDVQVEPVNITLVLENYKR